MKKAVKHDDGKPRTDLLPPLALLGTARALRHGVKEYNSYNYKNGEGLDWGKPYAAIIRHILAFWQGEDIDKDSGLHHLDCAGAEMVILQDLVYSKIGKDTRFGIQ